MGLEPSTLTPTNKADLARTFTRKVTQWPEGWDLLMEAKRARDSKDPLWNQ